MGNRNAEFLSESQLDALGFHARGTNVLIHSTCVLVGCERMSIGSHVRIDPFCVLSAGEGIRIGSHVHIAGHCMFAGAALIDIQDFVGISHGSKVLSSTDNFTAGVLTGPTIPDEYKKVLSAKVTFGRHSVVGAQGVVLPGVHVGEGATVGALALIKDDLEPWSVSVGCPARKIGMRNKDGVLDAEVRFRERTS